MKKILVLAAAAGLMFASSAASAQAVKVTNIAFTPGSVTGTVRTPSINDTVGVGQFQFKGTYVSGGGALDVLTYCIDLTRSVAQGNVNYNYTVIPISTYAGMSQAKIDSLNALLTNTTSLLAAASGQAAINISAATQMAVWEIMYETKPAWSVTNTSSTFYMTTPGGSSNANTNALTSAESLANTYLNNVKTNVWTVNNAYDLKVLYSSTQQSQVFLTPSVPEPATWGMLLLGFGLIGGALRIRRNSNVLAAA